MRNRIDFIPDRDKELYEAYKRCLRDKAVHSHQAAVRKAIKSPTSRFWISSYQAYRGVLQLLRGRDAMQARSVRCRMLEQVYAVFCELQQRPEFRRQSVYFTVSFAVQMPAPEFYLSYSRALAIIYKMRSDERKK